MNFIKNIVHKHLLNEVRVKTSDRIKLYEDTEWVVIVPLTHRASCKYGHGSKWCTSTPSEVDSFENYNNSGILVYYINKKTDDKYAESINYNGIQIYDKQDKEIDNLPSFLTNIQDQIKNNVFELLRKKKDDSLNKFKNSPSLEWLNQLWSEMVEFKSDKLYQFTYYGKSKDDIYFQQDERQKMFWFDYDKIWLEVQKENQWNYQQTLEFFKYWLTKYLKLSDFKLFVVFGSSILPK